MHAPSVPCGQLCCSGCLLACASLLDFTCWLLLLSRTGHSGLEQLSCGISVRGSMYKCCVSTYLPHSADKWKVCPYRGSRTIKGLWGDNWTAYQLYANPNSPPQQAAGGMLFRIIFNQAFSILWHTQASLPMYSLPLFSRRPSFSPSFLRGLVRLPENRALLSENETCKSSSETGRT